MTSRRSLSAQVPIITVPRTMVLPNPVFISIHILSGEPSIQCLLQIIQVLRLSVCLSLSRARIVLGHTREPLYYLEEPHTEKLTYTIVSTDSSDCIISRSLQLTAQIVRPGIHIILQAIGADSIGIILTSYLFKVNIYFSYFFMS